MSNLTDLLIKLIPIFPLTAVILNGLLGSRYSRDMAHRLAWGSVGLSFLCTVGSIHGCHADWNDARSHRLPMDFWGGSDDQSCLPGGSVNLRLVAGRHRCGFSDPRLFRRLYAWGSRVYAILHVYEFVHGLHAAARHGEQLCGALHRLGGGRALFLSVDRLLL